MKAFLVNLVKSHPFKVFLGAIAAAVAAYASTGCGAFAGKPAHVAVAVAECKIAVLAPYLGDEAAAVAREIDGNQAFSAAQFLLAQGLTIQEIVGVAHAYQACVPSDDATLPPLGADAGS